MSSLTLAIALSFVSAGEAQAGFKKSGFAEADFFDFERAKAYWLEADAAQLEADDKECLAGPYGAWVARFKKNGDTALSELEGHDGAAQIKRCYDMQLVANVWSRMYSTWQKGRSFRAEPFNENTRMITCTAMSSINVFTGGCNDMPDWRSPSWRARDERVLDAYRQREAERAARRAEPEQ